MLLFINGEKTLLDKENLSVIELLKISSVKDPELVSVQINGGFLEKEKYQSRKVSDGDEIEFLYFMGGGSL